MNNEKMNIKNTEKLFSLIPTIKNMLVNENEIAKWIKEDINEIHEIQRKLNKQSLLKFAYKKKEIVDMMKLEQYIEKREIFKIYDVINKELNNWRNVNICIQACYAQIN